MKNTFKTKDGKEFSTAEEMADNRAYHEAMFYGNCESHYTHAASETVKETQWNDLKDSEAVMARVGDVINNIFFGKKITLPKK